MKKLFVFALLSLFLVSCIEYHEKMKLNYNGSGELTFAFGLSEALINMGGNDNKDLQDFSEEKIKESYKNKKGIKLLGSRNYSEGGNKWIEISIAFESLKDLVASAKDSTQQAIVGEISLTEDANGNMVFTRKLSRNDKATESDSTSKDFGKGMMEMMFGQYKWHYQLTVPGKIITSNAVQNDIDNSTNTVKWTVSMASLIQPQLMTVTFAKESKSNLTLIILGVIVVITLATIFFINVSKKKKEENI